MYILERKIVSQLLLVICAFTAVAAEGSAITLPELRQIATDSRESVTTAHLVYIDELNDNRPIDGNENSLEYKLEKISNHRLMEVDTIIDCKAKKAKSSLTELRDVNEVLKEYNLPARQKMNVSWTKTVIYHGNYEMELVDSSILNEGHSMMGLFENPGPANYLFKMISLGVINDKLLSEDYEPTLSDINSNGKSLLRIELTRERKNASKTTIKIDCDPLLKYRFRRIERRSDGHLIKEIIADDYRDVSDVNGVVPYPFLYIERSYYKDGQIRRDRKYIIKDVKLGVDLGANDFKIFVPAGTHLTDAVVSMTIHKIEQSGYMDIDDALDVVKSSLLKQ